MAGTILLIAEGGTGFNHAVMIATSKNITGPYVPNDRNPILTSRHLSYDYWVNSTGHADMVEMPDGVWNMVCLELEMRLTIYPIWKRNFSYPCYLGKRTIRMENTKIYFTSLFSGF